MNQYLFLVYEMWLLMQFENIGATIKKINNLVSFDKNLITGEVQTI